TASFASEWRTESQPRMPPDAEEAAAPWIIPPEYGGGRRWADAGPHAVPGGVVPVLVSRPRDPDGARDRRAHAPGGAVAGAARGAASPHGQRPHPGSRSRGRTAVPRCPRDLPVPPRAGTLALRGRASAPVRRSQGRPRLGCAG